MIEDYFLLPSDIKYSSIGQHLKFKLKCNSNLSYKVVNLYVMESDYKLKLAEEIDLRNEYYLKSLAPKYKNLVQRLDNIHSLLVQKTIIFDGNTPKIMGIINVTKDSFYDGGKYFDTSKAIKKAFDLIDEGADIIDIGGESTRPGSFTIPKEEELTRILPVIKELCKNNILVSCDTRNSSTMKVVLDHGVKIINDVSGLNYDELTPKIIKEYNCHYVLMHSIKTPNTMQLNPIYKNVVVDIYDFFSKKKKFLIKEGIKPEKLIIDPGIGFGKNDFHNFEILKYFSIFLDLGLPLLIGLSRKSFIGRFIKDEKEDRLAGSLSLALDAFLKGASVIRVHDVKATNNAIKIFKKASY